MLFSNNEIITNFSGVCKLKYVFIKKKKLFVCFSFYLKLITSQFVLRYFIIKLIYMHFTLNLSVVHVWACLGDLSSKHFALIKSISITNCLNNSQLRTSVSYDQI